jgi:hypothetical protein
VPSGWADAFDREESFGTSNVKSSGGQLTERRLERSAVLSAGAFGTVKGRAAMEPTDVALPLLRPPSLSDLSDETLLDALIFARGVAHLLSPNSRGVVTFMEHCGRVAAQEAPLIAFLQLV